MKHSQKMLRNLIYSINSKQLKLKNPSLAFMKQAQFKSRVPCPSSDKHKSKFTGFY